MSGLTPWDVRRRAQVAWNNVQLARQQLDLTKQTIQALSASLENPDVPPPVHLALRDTVSRMAIAEWGEHTHCRFDLETKTVTVENFDGRKAVLSI